MMKNTLKKILTFFLTFFLTVPLLKDMSLTTKLLSINMSLSLKKKSVMVMCLVAVCLNLFKVEFLSSLMISKTSVPMSSMECVLMLNPTSFAEEFFKILLDFLGVSCYYLSFYPSIFLVSLVVFLFAGFVYGLLFVVGLSTNIEKKENTNLHLVISFTTLFFTELVWVVTNLLMVFLVVAVVDYMASVEILICKVYMTTLMSLPLLYSVSKIIKYSSKMWGYMNFQTLKFVVNYHLKYVEGLTAKALKFKKSVISEFDFSVFEEVSNQYNGSLKEIFLEWESTSKEMWGSDSNIQNQYLNFHTLLNILGTVFLMLLGLYSIFNMLLNLFSLMVDSYGCSSSFTKTLILPGLFLAMAMVGVMFLLDYFGMPTMIKMKKILKYMHIFIIAMSTFLFWGVICFWCMHFLIVFYLLTASFFWLLLTPMVLKFNTFCFEWVSTIYLYKSKDFQIMKGYVLGMFTMFSMEWFVEDQFSWSSSFGFFLSDKVFSKSPYLWEGFKKTVLNLILMMGLVFTGFNMTIIFLVGLGILLATPIILYWLNLKFMYMQTIVILWLVGWKEAVAILLLIIILMTLTYDLLKFKYKLKLPNIWEVNPFLLPHSVNFFHCMGMSLGVLLYVSGLMFQFMLLHYWLFLHPSHSLFGSYFMGVFLLFMYMGAFNMGCMTSLVMGLKSFSLMTPLNQPKDSLEVLTLYKADKVFSGNKWTNILKVWSVSHYLFGLLLVFGGLFMVYSW